jgi:hypothetical protein
MTRRTWSIISWVYIFLPLVGIFLYEVMPFNPEIFKSLESVDNHTSHKKVATMAMNAENRSASFS